MHQQSYTFPAPIVSSRPPMSSHYAPYNPRSNSTSSRSSTTEFKGSTNPSEDWTKISDLAERRRIQNRIAQRNYRKKLKRRLEDLERRAHGSRSISPNGEETSDGRSTRESSTEQLQNSSAPTTTPTMASTAPVEAATIAPVSTGYEYSAPVYSTTSSSTPYPSQYRTATTMASTYSSVPATYVSSLDYQTPSSQYVYEYETGPVQTTSQTDMSVIDPSFITPLPSIQSTSTTSRVPGVMRTGGMYDMDNSSTISPYYLSNTYDLSDQYFSSGLSSSYYNLDNLNLLPPLVNTQYATSQRN